MSTAGYTCITCRVAFTTAELQRFHYKSDWHRYNLKRKVVEMPPVTAEDFKQRVLAQQALNADDNKNTSTFCKICCKHFTTENTYKNHLQSKKHKDTEIKAKKRMDSDIFRKNAKNLEKGLVEDALPEDNRLREEGDVAEGSQSTGTRQKHRESLEEDEAETWEDVEDEPLPITRCLFCSETTQSLEENVNHMTKEHSFFVPNIEFLVNPLGMVEYLGEKVGCGFMCLWCNDKGRAFYSVDAVQKHMRDKGHCKLQYDGDAAFEYTDFYDFRTSYSDQAGRGTLDEDDESDDEIETAVVEQNGYELVLPSGAKIGHRELMRYYRQNVPPTREVSRQNSRIADKLKSYYKAIGWTGAIGEAKSLQVKDLRYAQSFRNKQRLKREVKANSMQKYFRPQVIF